MIYEFNEFPVSEKTYDCAIIGAGPAGISCAKRLAEIGFRCIVLEGGGAVYPINRRVCMTERPLEIRTYR